MSILFHRLNLNNSPTLYVELLSLVIYLPISLTRAIIAIVAWYIAVTVAWL